MGPVIDKLITWQEVDPNLKVGPAAAGQLPAVGGGRRQGRPCDHASQDSGC